MRRSTSVITIGLLLVTSAAVGAQPSMALRGESGDRGPDRDRDCGTCDAIVAGAGALQHAALAFLLVDWESGARGTSGGASSAWRGWSSEAGSSGGSVVFAEAPGRSRATAPGLTVAASRAAEGWRGGWSHARWANEGWPFGHALGLRGQGLTEGTAGGTSGLLAPTAGGTIGGGPGGSISAPPALAATAAPEPATMALVATGLAGLAAARRKRSKR